MSDLGKNIINDDCQQQINVKDKVQDITENREEIKEDKQDNVEIKEEIKENPKIKHLCLSGGGLKGLAYIGCYQALHDLGILTDPLELESIIGTSAGAIAGFLILLGYKPEELYSFVTSFDYKLIKDVNFVNFFQTWGLESGNKIVRFFQAFMRKKTGQSDLTFKQFYERFPVKFTVVVTNLRTHRPEYYNHENTPDEYVIWAIRKSISLPVFFDRVSDTETGDCWVDGGLLDNFPIQMCPDTKETLGIYCGSGTDKSYQNNCLEDYFSNIFRSVLNLTTKYKLEKIKNARIIKIENLGIYGYNMILDFETKKKFYHAGYDSLKSHFEENLFEE